MKVNVIGCWWVDVRPSGRCIVYEEWINFGGVKGRHIHRTLSSMGDAENFILDKIHEREAETWNDPMVCRR